MPKTAVQVGSNIRLDATSQKVNEKKERLIHNIL